MGAGIMTAVENGFSFRHPLLRRAAGDLIPRPALPLVTIGPRPVSGWKYLTDTERIVSELAAQGLNNRQVADEMYIGVNIVAFYMRLISRKLNIGSASNSPISSCSKSSRPRNHQSGFCWPSWSRRRLGS